MKTAHNGLYIALNKSLIASAVAFSTGVLISMAAHRFDKDEPYSRPLPPGRYVDFSGKPFTIPN